MEKIINTLDSYKWSLLTFIFALVIGVFVMLGRTFKNIEFFGFKILLLLSGIASMVLGVVLGKTALIIVGICLLILLILLVASTLFSRAE